MKAIRDEKNAAAVRAFKRHLLQRETNGVPDDEITYMHYLGEVTCSTIRERKGQHEGTTASGATLLQAVLRGKHFQVEHFVLACDAAPASRPPAPTRAHLYHHHRHRLVRPPCAAQKSG